MTISVIICTKKRKKDFLECLSCLRKQTRLPDECIVVENITAGSYFSLNKLQHFFSGTRVKCKYVPTKKTFLAGSRNIGIKNCSSVLGLFIDDDVLFSKELVRKYLELHKTHSKALGFVGKVFPVEKSIYSKFGSWYFMGKLIHQKKMRKVTHFAGSTFSFRKSAIKKYHIFNNEDLASAEDTDFFIRLHEKKQFLYFVPSIHTTHKFANTFFLFIQKHFKYAQYYAYIAKNYPRFFNIDGYFPSRKCHLMFFPAFVLKSCYNFTKNNVNKEQLPKELFWISYLCTVCEFFGIYSSLDGRKYLEKCFMKVVLHRSVSLLNN